jgi:hypothetical protein
MKKINLIDVENLTIGFNNRKDTYSGKLAFLSYSNNAKSLINEIAFNRWIDKKIPLLKLKNVSSNGFVLAKSNLHHLYQKTIGFIRVYHPEGFDFEIPLDNFYYLMQYTLIDRGQISGDCKIYFAEDGKPWILNSEAINSDEFNIKKVNGNYLNKKSVNLKDLQVGDLVTVNKKQEEAILINSLKAIYPYAKNSSIFDADYYLLDLDFNNISNHQRKLLYLTDNNDYKNIIIKNSANDIYLVEKSLNLDKKIWIDKLSSNNHWDFINWNNRVDSDIDYEDKSIGRILKNVIFKNFNELSLDDVDFNLQKSLIKKSLDKILVSNFLLTKNNVNYRFVVTKNQKLEEYFSEEFLLKKDYYIYMIHFGRNELLKRIELSNEEFNTIHIVPIASLYKNDLSENNIINSTEIIKNTLKNKGFKL